MLDHIVTPILKTASVNNDRLKSFLYRSRYATATKRNNSAQDGAT